MATSTRTLDTLETLVQRFNVLPNELQSKILMMSPPPRFLAEFKRDCGGRVCMWCQHAFNAKSMEHIVFYPAAMRPDEDLDSIHSDEDSDDPDLIFQTQLRSPFYVCTSCIYDHFHCGMWLLREMTVFRMCMFSTFAGAGYLAAANQSRPPQVRKFLEACGIAEDVCFVFTDGKPLGSPPVGGTVLADFSAESEGRLGPGKRCLVDVRHKMPVVRSKAAAPSVARLRFLYGVNPRTWPVDLQELPIVVRECERAAAEAEMQEVQEVQGGAAVRRSARIARMTQKRARTAGK